MKLKNKVIVITGSTGGVGLATVRAAAREGAKLVICGRHADTVRETVAALQESGAKASGIQTDVSNPNDLAALLEHADRNWGRIDAWINNAGVGTGTRPLTSLSSEEIIRTVTINVIGTAEACRIVIPYMLKQGGGLLFNTTGRGADGKPQGGAAIYSATKAAVISLTKSLAEENLGQPISIHAISPGLVLTGLHKSRLDEKKNPKLAAHTRKVLAQWGTSPAKVGEYFAEIASQEPGKLTGYFYRMSAGRTSQLNMLEELTPSQRKL